LISKLQSDFKTRTAYIQAKVGTLVPSQIRALRMKSETPRQPDLAHAAEMHQSRISMLETAGSNPTLGTLSAIASALKVGLKVEFVPFSEMLAWENSFLQDEFKVETLDNDRAFLNPQPTALPTTAVPATAFYRPHGARPATWRNHLTVYVGGCVGSFSTTHREFFIMDYEPQQPTGPISGEVGATVFIPVTHSQLTQEGIR
jgi:transcriptional regulator with XRE-family HTH domain